MKEELLKNVDTENHKVAIYLDPDLLTLGVEFWLRSRGFSRIVDHDVVLLHHEIYDVHASIIQGYKDDGYCLGVYGGSEAQITDQSWTALWDYAVVDSPANVQWSDGVTVYSPLSQKMYVACLFAFLPPSLAPPRFCAI